MEFLELAADRYSCRAFRAEPVGQADLDRILMAARLAPTAHNNQPQEIIVVRSEEGLSRLEKCTVCHYHAPLALIVCYDKSKAWVRDYDGRSSGDVDASIVATHMLLEAKSLGIDSVWIMYFIPEAVKTEFELPDGVEPVAILYMGYASEGAAPAHSERRAMDEYVTYR